MPIGATSPDSSPAFTDILPLHIARGTTRFVCVADIATISAAQNHSTVQLVNGHRLRVRCRMSRWETLLPAGHFVRVHRQHSVSLGRFRGIERLTDDTSLLDVADAAAPVRELPLSAHVARATRRASG